MKASQDIKLQLPKSILIAGEPGSGKTILATQMPKPFILNVDNNINGPIRWLRGNNQKLDFKYGDVMLCDESEALKAIGYKGTFETNIDGYVVVPRTWRYRLAAYYLQQAVDDPTIETLVLDSFTSLNEVIKDEVRRQYDLPLSEVVGNKVSLTVDKRPDKQSFALWDGYLSLARNLIFELKATGKRLVCITHTTSKDFEGTLREFIAIPGQFGEQIASFFEEVWRLETQESFKGGKTITQRFVRTRPKPHQHALGLKSAAQLSDLESLESFETFLAKLA